MKKWNDEERRKLIRLRIKPSSNKKIEVQIIGPNFIEHLYARDISPSGIGIFVPHNFKDCNIDDVLDFVITLPKKKAIKCQGKIIHIQTKIDGFFGAEFLQLSNEDQDQLLEYVEQNLEKGETH